jgi:hypothetical protein
MATETVIIPVEVKGASEAESDLKGVTDATKKATAATEEQGETLVDVGKDYELFGVSVNSVSEGFKNSIQAIKNTSKSLGVLKTALLATGIGAFVVAIGALATAFQRSKRLQDEFRRSSAAIKATWGIVAGSVTDATEALLGFNDEQERLSFGSRAILGITKALEAVGIVTAGTSRALEVGLKIVEDQTQAYIDLEESTSEYELTIARINRRLEENILLSDDQESRGAEFQTTISQTIELFDQLESATNTRFNNEVRLLENQIALAEAQSDTVKATELQIQLNQILIEQEDALGGIEGRRSAEIVRFNQARVESNKLLNESITIQQKGVQSTIEAGNIRIDTEKKVATETATIQQKQTQFGISNALTEIRAQLAVALAKVFGQTGIGGFIAGTIIIGAFDQIVGRLTSLTAQAIPSFESGGWIGGNLHSNGGTLIEAERGEYVINRRSMSNPEVSSIAQALNNYGQSKGFKYQQGGFVQPSQPSFGDIQTVLERLPRAVLVTEDLKRVQGRVGVTDRKATL